MGGMKFGPPPPQISLPSVSFLSPSSPPPTSVPFINSPPPRCRRPPQISLSSVSFLSPSSPPLTSIPFITSPPPRCRRPPQIAPRSSLQTDTGPRLVHDLCDSSYAIVQVIRGSGSVQISGKNLIGSVKLNDFAVSQNWSDISYSDSSMLSRFPIKSFVQTSIVS
ncbi:hypothetical protein ACFE04_031363 [Oxalis oulophora]